MSSKRGQRRRECERKVRHETREAAEIARVRTGRHSVMREGRIGLQAYRCNNCGGWHVGHRPGVTLFVSTGMRKASARGHIRLRGAA